MGIVTDMASSTAMTDSLVGGAADLTTEINTQLAATDFSVEVEQIAAAPEVTVTYEIRTTDAAAATAAQETIAAASTEGSSSALVSGLTANLADTHGVQITITEMTSTASEVRSVSTASPSSPSPPPTTSNAFRLGHRDVVSAVVVAAAVALAQLRRGN